MDNELQVFNYKDAEVRTLACNGEIWFVAKDVCDVLGLADVTSALRTLDEDEKLVRKISGAGQIREMSTISESGLYALIFRSSKPEAKQFSRWVRSEVLPQIRQTGSYNKKPRISSEELEISRRDLDIRGAQILQSLLDNNTFPCTPETRTVFSHEIFKLVTGHECLTMLPESTEKWYRAGEIGEILGISANKVGRIAKEYGIQPEQGTSNKYARWIFSKSRSSNHECSTCIYNSLALEWFKDFAGM